MIEAKKTMPEQPEYFDKYLEGRFKHIDESIDNLKDLFVDFRQEVRQENEATRKEVKEENKTTRKWLVTTAVSLMVGFTAIAISIFFGFSKLQTSWIQTVISFVGKTVVK